MDRMQKSPEELVREGWDLASYSYRPEGVANDPFGHLKDYRNWLSPLFDNLSAGSRILDLGCGCGIPVSSLLAERFAVTGIDISEVQINRARELVPNARFIREDMARVSFDPSTFSGVVAFYSLIHLPLDQQRPLLGRIREWLVPKGWLLVVTGHEAYEGVEQNWLGSGATMFWSHAGAPIYRRWLEELGFQVWDQAFIPEGLGGHELFRATTS